MVTYYIRNSQRLGSGDFILFWIYVYLQCTFEPHEELVGIWYNKRINSWGPAIKKLDKPKQNCDHKSSIIYLHLLIRALMISTQSQQGEVCEQHLNVCSALSPVFPFCLGFATVTGRN